MAGTGRPDEDGDEFGLFDESVAGDARDPYPELAQAGGSTRYRSSTRR